jgi:hypothetical protein
VKRARYSTSLIGLILVAGCGRVDFDLGDPDLIAWYQLDTLGGGAAIDSTGHRHTAVCDDATASCPRVVPGHHGNAMTFDGVDARLVVGPIRIYSRALDTSEITELAATP